MGSTMIVEGIAAGPAELKTSKGGKTYAVLTILETVRTKQNGEWKDYGRNVFKVQIWGYAAHQAATYKAKTPVFAHLRDVITRAYIGEDGNAYANIYGTANMVGRREPWNAPKEEAKAIAAQTAERMRQERAEAEAQHNDDSHTTDAPKGKETPEQYRARQQQQRQQAELLNKATEAKQARDTATPQPTDLATCKTCGETFERRTLTRAGNCTGCKKTRRSPRPAAEAAAQVDMETLRHELYADTRA